jgi:hypothetical protein
MEYGRLRARDREPITRSSPLIDPAVCRRLPACGVALPESAFEETAAPACGNTEQMSAG